MREAKLRVIKRLIRKFLKLINFNRKAFLQSFFNKTVNIHFWLKLHRLQTQLALLDSKCP